jgi:transposase-like protein
VDVNQVLDALERERELLREFHDLSSQQLILLDNENLDDMSKVLDARSDLMLELTAIETTLGTWITQLRNESKITPEVLRELRLVNDEIVHLANEIVELDEQTHWRLDLIKQKAADDLHRVNRSNDMLSGYTATLRIQPNFKFNC